MNTHKILQITDLHILPHTGSLMLGIDTEYYFARVLEHAHQFHGEFDLILVTGDLAQEPCPASYRRIKAHLHAYRTPCLCLPGNHDDFSLMQSVFDSDMINCAKQANLGHWCVICLNSQKPDSPNGLLDAGELIFLERTLGNYPNAPTLLALHHPCMASGAKWLDSMQIENSQALLQIVERWPQVKVIVCGHLHQSLEMQLPTVRFYATPSTCFQFTPGSEDFSIDSLSPGYRVLELFEDGHLISHCQRIPDTLSALDRRIKGY